MPGRQFNSCLALIILALGAPLTAQAQAPASIPWRTEYQAARQEAQEKNLPLLLDFGTKDCFWCKKLDDITFKDAKVSSLMIERFVCLKIDAERDPDLTRTLRIERFPTIVLAAPDGKLLNSLEGFKDAAAFHEILQRVLATLTDPDWMIRDFQVAQKALEAQDYSRAISTLKSIVEDGKGRSTQVKAQKALLDLEQQAAGRLTEAQQLVKQGKFNEAIDFLNETGKIYPGLKAARDAGELITRIAQSPEVRNQQRSTRAKELLVQARGFFQGKDYYLSLYRCRQIIKDFGDLPEGQEAAQIAGEIRSNSEWLQEACLDASEQLRDMYLAQADASLKKGQPQLAAGFLELVIRTFPGTRQAEQAQIRLGQLQGVPARRVDLSASDKRE